MAETESSSSTRPEFRKEADCFCGTVRKAFQQAADAMMPPEEARKHFRQARVEMLKGVRELIDLKIAHLSRDTAKGTRVAVE